MTILTVYPRLVLSVLTAYVLTLVIAGCGNVGIAQDALVENPDAEAFLTRVGAACGDLHLGDASIAYLMQSQDDTDFVDLTTMLWSGQINRDQYASELASFYPGTDGARVAGCVAGQMRVVEGDR